MGPQTDLAKLRSEKNSRLGVGKTTGTCSHCHTNIYILSGVTSYSCRIRLDTELNIIPKLKNPSILLITNSAKLVFWPTVHRTESTRFSFVSIPHKYLKHIFGMISKINHCWTALFLGPFWALGLDNWRLDARSWSYCLRHDAGCVNNNGRLIFALRMQFVWFARR